jgi:hypothetical protein
MPVQGPTLLRVVSRKINSGEWNTPSVSIVGTFEGLADRYTSGQNEKDREHEKRIVEIVSPSTRKSGSYTRDNFLERCRWKTVRTQPRCDANDERFVVEVTALALQAESERLRIGALTLLDGVGRSPISAKIRIDSIGGAI